MAAYHLVYFVAALLGKLQMPLTFKYPAVIENRSNFKTDMLPETWLVCLVLMALGFRDINKSPALVNHADRLAELDRRVKAYEALCGGLMFKETEDDRLVSSTFETLVKHWGIETNVSGLTAVQFDAKLRRISREKAKAAKAKAKADRLAARAATIPPANQSLGQRLGGLWA